MAELADALDSGSSEQYVHGGSSPLDRTTSPEQSTLHLKPGNPLQGPRFFVALPYPSFLSKAGLLTGGKGLRKNLQNVIMLTYGYEIWRVMGE